MARPRLAPMKTFVPPLFAFICFFVPQLAFPAVIEAPSAPPAKHDAPSTPKPVRTYADILAHIPVDLRGTKPTAWTRSQREDVNAVFQEALIDRQTPGRMVLKVTQIANWGGMTFFSEVPNDEGYHIRVFGKFADGWDQKLVELKPGDTAILKGVLKSVTYRNLWGVFTLSICLKDCTFTKVDAGGKPNLVL